MKFVSRVKFIYLFIYFFIRGSSFLDFSVKLDVTFILSYFSVFIIIIFFLLYLFSYFLYCLHINTLFCGILLNKS